MTGRNMARTIDLLLSPSYNSSELHRLELPLHLLWKPVARLSKAARAVSRELQSGG
jgi:hypothetical protein